jgi:pyruvate,water dikinase
MKNQITPLLEINPGTESIQVSAHQPLVIWFDQIRLTDVPMVGGKNASLGEMVRELSAFGVKVPHGFAITAFAYR